MPHYCPSHQFILLTQGSIPKIFTKKHWELVVFKNSILSQSTWNFLFALIKISQSFLSSKDGSKFWWLPLFPAQSNTYVIVCNTVYWYKNSAKVIKWDGLQILIVLLTIMGLSFIPILKFTIIFLTKRKKVYVHNCGLINTQKMLFKSCFNEQFLAFSQQ